MTVKWTAKNPFEQKVFIENKGQYEIQVREPNITVYPPLSSIVDPGEKLTSEILFGARQGGVQYYFTNNSIWIARYVFEPGESANEQSADGEKEPGGKMIQKFHEITFLNAAHTCTITAETPAPGYYNFTTKENRDVVAHAFKKITYHDLYPGIDMEFYFPEDKPGFKYVFVVHPGADVSKIRMQYPLSKDLELNGEDNIIVTSDFGQFVDHAPLTKEMETSKPVTSSFVLHNSVVKFKIGDYDKNQTLIIDPWTAIPTFTGSDHAQDVDWDYAGNVYTYGGGYPFQLLKYDGSGNFIWSYTITFSWFTLWYYGDFAVDKTSQSAYIIQGYNASGNGAQILKVNSSGAQIGLFAGDANMDEMWRIEFSPCKEVAVIAGGNTDVDYQASILDTSVSTLTPVNVLNATHALHDFWGLALDNNGSCYMATVRSVINDTSFADNIIVKAPLPALTPTSWSVSDNYRFVEAESINYSVAVSTLTGYSPNGYNGMSISNSHLYSYDGYVLKKWDAGTGAALANVKVNGTSKDVMWWGGIASDNCDHIFLGSKNNIKQYDGNLNSINSTLVTDTVFDISLSKGDNILYVCGAGFLSAVQTGLSSCFSASNNVINPTCSNPLGMAIITPNGGTTPYTVSWNTVPVQNGDTAKNLLPGTYIATITDNSCPKQTTYDTVTIIKSGTTVIVTVNSPSVCSGSSVVLKAGGAKSYAWSPSTGLSSTIDSVVIANPTVTTTYTVIGTTTGCSDTVKSVVTVNPLPIVTIVPPSVSVCNGLGVTVTASGASTYQWSPSTGLSATSGASVIADPVNPTTYTVTGTDTSGCMDTASISVDIGAPPVVSFTMQAPSVCNPQEIQFTNTSVGGSIYLWNFGDGNNGTSPDPLHNYNKQGIYIVKLVVTTSSGCMDSTTAIDTIAGVNKDVTIANAFTPNGDGINDLFKPQLNCSSNLSYLFRVYSRWGELLFETTNPIQAWDGSYNGIMEPMDVYVYYIQYRCGNCTIFSKGNVTLLR